MKKISVSQMCILALCTALNFIGGMIALAFRLPIYLDCIGTLGAAFLYGPLYGMAVGAASGLLNGMIFDAVSFYFIPSAMLTGAMAGILGRKGWLKGKRFLAGVLALSLPGTAASSVITAAVFGGITSSGSSVLVQLFFHLGLPMTASVLVVQAVTDYGDRLITTALVLAVLTAMPYAMKGKTGLA